MCLSATTSFAAGAVLVPAGAYCLWKAARKDPRYLPLAALPAIFGVQQFAEGAVWRALGSGSGTIRPGSAPVATFLGFALAFWPVWLPFSMAWLVPGRRTALAALGALGLWVGWSLYTPILSDPDRYLSVSVRRHSICYDITRLPVLRVIPEHAMRGLYGLAIVGPLLLGDRKLWGFGVAVLASMVVSELVFAYAFASVWCLFAALLSAYLVCYTRELPPVLTRR